MLNPGRLLAFAASCVLAAGLASSAAAQVFTGRIDLAIEDATGGRLPGATVEIAGPVAQSQTSDSQGQAHFLNLPVGPYSVKVTLAGFNTFTGEGVPVVSGGAVPLDIRLAVAGTVEAITISAAAPILDVKKQTTTTNVTANELQGIPSARDPWAIMQTVPAVYMDRVNVGGAESGQQSAYNAKGAIDSDNTWSIDGVTVTDMGSTGSSAFYFHVDSFTEMAVTTGGADAQNATGGVQLNLVLKKGTNTPHGTVSTYFSSDATQSVNISPELAAALGNPDGRGNRTDQYFDRGFDLGGAVVKDRLWAWGHLAQTTINLLALSGAPDNTTFKTRALKLDGRVSDNVRGNFTFYYNNKIKVGRDASLLRPPETTWTQTGVDGGGSRYFKGEASLVTGQRLFTAVRAARVRGGFRLAAAGGDVDFYEDENGVWHNSYFGFEGDRPQNSASGDSSFFTGAHEVRFGASWRSNPVVTSFRNPASHIWTLHDQMYPRVTAQAARDTNVVSEASYLGAFVTDTISLDRLTLTGGIRVDRQAAGLGESSIPGVSGIGVLPAVNAPASPDLYIWNTVTPRLGATLALDGARKTVARASYAAFASQLTGTQANFVSPIQMAFAFYNAVDRNRDHIAQVSEILFNEGLQGFIGVDPNDPTRLTSVNRIDPNVKAPMTHEAIIALDRELMPNLAVGATFTWRRMNDLLWEPLIGVTASDYLLTGTRSGTLPELGDYSVPLYALRPSAVPPGGGRLSTNRQGYHQRYVGLELQMTKRLSDRWMGRVGFSTNAWTEHFDDASLSILDPTKAPASNVTTEGRPFAGPQLDGGAVVRSASGSGKSPIYMVAPRYQFIANGMYQVSHGFSVAGSLVTRDGYAEPFFRSRTPTGDPLGAKTILIAPAPDAFRLPAATSFDARVEWKGTWGGRYSVALDLDVFNVFNTDTILGKQLDARFETTAVTGFGKTLEIMNPRVARVALRFMF